MARRKALPACEVVMPLEKAAWLTFAQALARVADFTRAQGREAEVWYGFWDPAVRGRPVTPIVGGTECHVNLRGGAIPRSFTAPPGGIGILHSHPMKARECSFSPEDVANSFALSAKYHLPVQEIAAACPSTGEVVFAPGPARLPDGAKVQALAQEAMELLEAADLAESAEEADELADMALDAWAQVLRRIEPRKQPLAGGEF